MFQKDFNWQMNYYAQVQQILKQNAMYIIQTEVADAEADMKQATDFIVKVKGGTVAVRIRRNVANSFRDLTIRSKRPNGYETELQKIQKGFADFYLYIWTLDEKVIDWWLVDMNKMRSAGVFSQPRKEIWNKDGSSAFIAFVMSEIQKIGALVSAMKLTTR